MHIVIWKISPQCKYITYIFEIQVNLKIYKPPWTYLKYFYRFLRYSVIEINQNQGATRHMHHSIHKVNVSDQYVVLDYRLRLSFSLRFTNLYRIQFKYIICSLTCFYSITWAKPWKIIVVQKYSVRVEQSRKHNIITFKSVKRRKIECKSMKSVYLDI